MNRSADDAIERIRVREVAAIFHSQEALEATVRELLVAGFDRADMDRLADLDEVRERLGPAYIAHEELADIPQAPRQPVITREDITAARAVIASVFAALGGVFAALVVVVFDGGTAAAVTIALLAALAVGAIASLLTIRILRPAQSRALEPLMAAHGIVLWVRVRTPNQEDKAQQILRQHGGQAIRVHEIEVEKHPEEIPLSSLRPDPWLGNERLGRP
jgi:VIT1/CCC1 family predicted Fe2+/Mn2+ transporter